MAMTKKQKQEAELEAFYDELVPVMLVKDNWKHKDDLTVTVNGVNYQIKRGESVMVPRKVALAVERADRQAAAAEKYIDSLKEA